MAWDMSTIVAVTGAGSAAVSGLLTLAATKGVDAIIRLRKSKTDNIMEERKHEDVQAKEFYAQATAAYQLLIQQFEARVAVLEAANLKTDAELKATRADLMKSRDEHANCMIGQESLRGDLKALQVHVDRLWSHDKAGKEQLALTQANIKALESVVATPALPAETKDGP